MTGVNGPAVALFLALAAFGCGGNKNTFLRAFAEGHRAYSAGRYLEAAAEYEEAAKVADKDRDRDEAMYSAGVARLKGGDTVGALRIFDGLAAETPLGERGWRAAYRAATIRIAQGDTKRGYADLEKIYRAAPEHGTAKRALFAVVLNIEETEGKEAAIAFQEKLWPAVAKTRLGEEICYDVATRRKALGKKEEALAGFLSCADKYPYPEGALWDDSLWHASLLHEELGDPKKAIADLERILEKREKSYLSGSYNRPRMAPAQFRIAELQRDGLKDPAAARASFHRVYVEHHTSILCPKALWNEAKVAQDQGDHPAACALADKVLVEYKESRYARRADEVCEKVKERAEALRKERLERRKKGAVTKDDED